MAIANIFQSLQPDLKESYSDQKPKKKRFSKLKEAMGSNQKATAEAKASENPMKALKDKSYLNIKNRKGVAV